MSTKSELEAENKSLQRELGSLIHASQVGSGAAATSRAQSAMNASIEVGTVSRVETMVGNNEKRNEQQAAVRNSGQDLAVSHSPVTQPAPPTAVESTEAAEVAEVEVESTEAAEGAESTEGDDQEASEET